MKHNHPKIEIMDTTLRDGEQSPGASMNPDEKLRIARQLEKLGVDIIEAGFPVASEGDFASVRQIAREIRGCGIAAWSSGSSCGSRALLKCAVSMLLGKRWTLWCCVRFAS